MGPSATLSLEILGYTFAGLVDSGSNVSHMSARKLADLGNEEK